MPIARRTLLAAATVAAVTFASHSFAEPERGDFTPEMFGAVGDGIADDSDAFFRLGAAVSQAGGGQIVLRTTTYCVGQQELTGRRGAGAAWRPARLLEILGCPLPVMIHGNGARIQCRPGLHYGSFDPVTGLATQHALPFLDSDEIASPYRYMILVAHCSGPVAISDLELDGNAPALELGGPFGDRGRQIPGIGLSLVANSGSELVTNVHTHHHALDGLKIDGVSADRTQPAVRRISGLRSHHNGRQGCSLVGGRGYHFSDCAFTDTGKGNIVSSPGAGLDLEGQDKQIRDIILERCRFENNRGPGLLAERGDVAGVTASDCRFVGTTSWSAWPNMPNVRFIGCAFTGSVVNCYGDRAMARAVRFEDCSFTDDPGGAVGGQVFLGTAAGGPIVDAAHGAGTAFHRCRFRLVGTGTLPWTLDAHFVDCTMQQASLRRAFPRGTYAGTNRIVGPVDLGRSGISGSLLVNGKRIAPRS